MAVSDQTGTSLPCSFNTANGLVTCSYAPSVIGSNTLTLSVNGSSFSRKFNVATPHGIYPQGDRMMVGAYDGYDSGGGFTNYLTHNFNVSQEYCSTCSAGDDLNIIDSAHAAGLVGAPGYLNNYSVCGSGGSTSTCESTYIAQMWSDPYLVFWGIPEESADTPAQDAAYSSYIHTNDSQHRPVFKYLPSGLSASSIQSHISVVDLVGEGEYPIDDGYGSSCNFTPLQALPPVFARYVVEQEIQAIKNAGYSVGPNYASSQKTPILIPETVPAGAYCSGAPGTTAASITNQIWNGLAAGAKGYLDYLWNEGALPDGNGVPAALSAANELLLGPEGVGEWMIKGVAKGDLPVTITGGPSTVSVSATIASFTYPSIRAAVWDWAGTRIIVAINSSSSSVTAKISGLPAGAPPASVVGESRTIAISGGALSDSFVGLGVHVYKLPMVSQQSDGSWIALQ